MTESLAPPAFVVGLCAHGLALVRALSRADIDVHVVEANPTLPGLTSRYGTKHMTPDVNGDGLVPSLIELRERISPRARPVLFLTNDRMVRSVAEQSEVIAQHFRLSWARSAVIVDALTHKTEIEARCRSIGLNYPETIVLDNPHSVTSTIDKISWPRILKPARPLSSFKVMLAATADEARSFLALRVQDFPILLQEWIPGDDTAIFFTAFFLNDGVPIARFDGRKLRSFPMGHTTIAEPAPNDAVFEYSEAFFAGTGISGPASLEVKVAPSGDLWVIEPTVGRTDFWLDLCIANGVNLPLIEYNHQALRPLEPQLQRDNALWINAERDPAAAIWYLANITKASRLARHIRFTYFDLNDPLPGMRSLVTFARRVDSWARSRLRRLLPGVFSRT